MNPEAVTELREILRGWCYYGPWIIDEQMIGHRHQPIPVDEMSDEEIVEVARKIAEKK